MEEGAQSSRSQEEIQLNFNFNDGDTKDFFLKNSVRHSSQLVLNKQARRLFKIGQGGASLPGLSYFSRKHGAMEKNIATSQIMESFQSTKILNQGDQQNVKKQLLPIIFSSNSNQCEYKIDFFPQNLEYSPLQHNKSFNQMNQINKESKIKKSKSNVGGVSFSSRHKGKDSDKKKESSKETFVQPEYMQERGSMCITELWPESMKLELVKSNLSKDNKPRELFHPKNYQQQQISSIQEETKDLEKRNSSLLISSFGGHRTNISMNNSVFEDDVKSSKFILPKLNSYSVQETKESKEKKKLKKLLSNSEHLENFSSEKKNTFLTKNKILSNKKLNFQKLNSLKSQCEELLEDFQELEQSIDYGINTVNARLSKFLSKLT